MSIVEDDTPSDERLMKSATRRERRIHRRRRVRRHGRRAYIRSVYFLPSMATLGNAVSGFTAIYVSAFDASSVGKDPIARTVFSHDPFVVAAYLIFIAMLFDGLDGRLARLTRHTTDFGGQLDSMADMISFGAAPAFLSLMLFKNDAHHVLPIGITRLIWAIGALYMSCAALRLARFNVSNEHGEQAHFSFLGLPSPGAAGAVAAFVLMQHDLADQLPSVGAFTLYLLPGLVLLTGLLMISDIRYPHIVNRYLRGKRSITQLIFGLMFLLLLAVNHRYTVGLATLAYVLWGLWLWGWTVYRRRTAA